MKKPDTIIIGGGVIGMACAHYLSHDGYKVLVMDRASAGSGASHGNCGLLYFTDIIPLCSPGAVSQELLRTLCHTSPLYIKPEYDLKRILWLIRFAMQCTHARRSASAANKLELLDYSAGLFSTLFSLNTIDCSYESRGILSVFKSKSAWEAFQTTNDFLKRYIKGYTPLSRDEALDLEPALRDDIAGAWHNTSDQHLRPDRLMKSWKSSLQSKGVDFIETAG